MFYKWTDFSFSFEKTPRFLYIFGFNHLNYYFDHLK